MESIEQAIERKRAEFRAMYPDLEDRVVDEVEALAEALAGQFGRYPDGVISAWDAILTAMGGWVNG